MTRMCTFCCEECGEDYRVLGDEELLRRCVAIDPKCPRCERPLRLGSSPAAKRRLVTELDAQEFWNAINGFGLPEEVEAGPEAIEAMLLAHRVVAADIRNTATSRVEIRSLTLNSGVKLHFAASGEGAVIFKSTKEK